MGGCLSSDRRRGVNNANSSENGSRPSSGKSFERFVFLLILSIYYKYFAASTRKNHPLCHEVIRWKSDVPLTDGQLRSKRDEFWDTAPAFEGSKEIWDALRAAAVALEASDYELAQAILDGAGISVPNGKFFGCVCCVRSNWRRIIYIFLMLQDFLLNVTMSWEHVIRFQYTVFHIL